MAPNEEDKVKVEKEITPETLENRYEFDKESRIQVSALFRSKFKKILFEYATSGDAKKLADSFSSLISKYTDKKLKYQFAVDGSSATLVPIDQKTKEFFEKLRI
jgi:hypothetical protein|nr:MAG TPA: hypothetical protein [Caudoviricetes sp.]